MPTRLLITGFGAFPGAPYNPTPRLVARLMALRRPALADVERIAHIFPVTYRAVDEQLPRLIDQHKPDALLMFGLATRTPYLRIETRARNTVTQIWPDSAHTDVRHRGIARGAPATMRFGPHTARLLRVAQQTGIDARASISAGFYLCNYLSWRAIECVNSRHDPEKWAPVFGQGHAETKHDSPRIAAFIHVPPVARGTHHPRKGDQRVSFEQMVDAGEAMMMEMAKLTWWTAPFAQG